MRDIETFTTDFFADHGGFRGHYALQEQCIRCRKETTCELYECADLSGLTGGMVPADVAQRIGNPFRCGEFEPIPITNSDPTLSAPVRGEREDLPGQTRLFEGDDT